MPDVECTTGAYQTHRNIFTKTHAIGKVSRESVLLTSESQQNRASQSLYALTSGQAIGCLLETAFEPLEYPCLW